MERKKSIAIVHYNTPELTEALVRSIRKVGIEWPVVIFDNSDTRPFKKRMKGVKVINNTRQQLVDFDKELDKYPDKCQELAYKGNFASVKHMMSVQKLFELVPDGFILMDSDVLLKRNVSFLWDEKFAASGRVCFYRGRRREPDRMLPYVCYLNVPLLTKHGARFYDPERCWGLQPGGTANRNNLYDTGASLLEDITKTKPELWWRNWRELEDMYVHFANASYSRSDRNAHISWLEEHKDLWHIPDNRDAKIFVLSHTDFEPVVTNEVYEIVSSRDLGDAYGDVPGPYYSELLHIKRVSERKRLPKYVGFVQYRKYFSFLDDVPDIAKVIDEHGAITPTPVDIGMQMHGQWGSWGNIEDLDLITQIVHEKYPEFAQSWDSHLNIRTMHPGSLHIMRTEDWREMVDVAWDVANEFWKRIGGDIDKRIRKNPSKYHLDEMEGTDLPNERRVGGNICERVVSAWIDWKFPNAAQYPMVITAAKIRPNFEEKPNGKPQSGKHMNKKEE